MSQTSNQVDISKASLVDKVRDLRGGESDGQQLSRTRGDSEQGRNYCNVHTGWFGDCCIVSFGRPHICDCPGYYPGSHELPNGDARQVEI